MGKKRVMDISGAKREIRVTGVGNTLHSELKNICDHIGTSLADFAKNKLSDIVHSYPPHYKQPMDKD